MRKNKALVHGLQRMWYEPRLPLWAWPLLPLSGLFAASVAIRRACYAVSRCRTVRFPVPVVVVGNISVGGTGKTPLVVWLCAYLRQRGWKPGVVLRGYGGQATHWPQRVNPGSDPRLVGDEAVLLAMRTQCPVVAAPERIQAVDMLLAEQDCDIVICDDGLQHYALARDIEIAVVDGQRGLGNGWMLPAGPLREPVSRLDTVDLCISNGPWRQSLPSMHIRTLGVEGLTNRKQCSLADFRGQMVHAIAGIGNPERFFTLLEQFGIEVIPHAFPDHHHYQPADLFFDDARPILMTEKDAVKCRFWADERHWQVVIEAQPEKKFIIALEQRLQDCLNGKEIA